MGALCQTAAPLFLWGKTRSLLLPAVLAVAVAVKEVASTQ
jgi:hypothetical protein